MDQSSDTTTPKTSPLIIKLCCSSSNKETNASSNELEKDVPASTSKEKPVTVKMKPVALTFCRLSKDGILTKSPEPLKISPALSLKLGAALRERISLKCVPSQKATFKTILGSEAERQSLTAHSSKLADDRLDFVHGGDKSQNLQLPQPPLTMQPSNLHTDDLLDAKYGGGGSEPTVVQVCSSSPSEISSGSATNSKKHFTTEEAEMEPAKKKIRLSDTIPVRLESQLDLLMDVQTENLCAKKTKIIKLKSPPNVKQSCLGGMAIVQSQQKIPLISSPSTGKANDKNVRLELDSNKSTVKRAEQPHFIDEHSSTNAGSKKEFFAENFKNSETGSKCSDVIKNFPDNIKVEEAIICDEKIQKKNESDILQSNKNFKSSDFSSSSSGDVLKSVNDRKSKVDDLLVSPKDLNKMDQKESLDSKIVYSFNQPIEKGANSSLKKAPISVKFDNKKADNSMEIDKKSKDNKNCSSSFNQDSKLCPFKLTFEGRFNTKSDKLKILEPKNSFELQHKVKNEVNCNVSNKNDMQSKESADSKDLFMEYENCESGSSKLNLEEKSKSNSQPKAVVASNKIENKSIISKEDEFGEPEFSGEDCNELVGISSDESNQLDSQNCSQEPEIEFDILDEFESNDNDPDQEVRTSDSESEIADDEIDAMLEAGLGDYGKPSAENQHEVKEKIILKVKGKDHFEVLPEGWIEVTHNSGIPIYLHKQTRVCCVSKPYFLGPGSTRKHEIPISAIPCLQYQKELEREKLEADNKKNGICEDLESENSLTNKESNEVNGNGDVMANSCTIKKEPTLDSKIKTIITGKKNAVQIASNGPKGSNLIFPSAKLESVKEVKVSGSLDYLAVREYCQKRFEFQTITVKKFKTWIGRRKHQKQMRRKQRPFLPDSTQLITCPLPSNTDKSTTIGNASKREFIMNPIGKSPVCILHEYVQHTLRVQPKYIFKELESASTPYGAVVIINEMEYGTGYGSSKKVAKSEAAKSALEVLIPKIKKIDPEKPKADDDEFQDVEFFDQVRVEDPRISDLSVKAGQPFPYQILLECLKRNYGMGDTEISIRMKNLKHQKNEFIMKVGKHKATVVCKNKRDGKHRASQAILQQLHPHINSWGSLLRMYGKGSCKTLKEKKEEEQRITELQSKACINKPNMSILNKLKEEMMKYREKMKSKKPIGKLIPERMQLFSISDSNLKSIEL